MREPTPTTFISPRQLNGLASRFKMELDPLVIILEHLGVGVDNANPEPWQDLSLFALSNAMEANGLFGAVTFDRLSAEYQGYTRLSDDQKDDLAAQAADLLGDFDSVIECQGSAFDAAARSLGFKSDADLEFEETGDA